MLRNNNNSDDDDYDDESKQASGAEAIELVLRLPAIIRALKETIIRVRPAYRLQPSSHSLCLSIELVTK